MRSPWGAPVFMAAGDSRIPIKKTAVTAIRRNSMIILWCRDLPVQLKYDFHPAHDLYFSKGISSAIR